MSSGAMTGLAQATLPHNDQMGSSENCDNSGLIIPEMATNRSEGPLTDAAAPAIDRSDAVMTDTDSPTTYPSGRHKVKTTALANLPIIGNVPVKKDTGDEIQEALGADRQRCDTRMKHILVFGSTGAGKSTLINHIAGSSLSTSSGVSGVSHSLGEVSVDHNHIKYRIIDTPGLNADHRGTTPSEDAKTSMENLLRRTAHHGLNLMIMVTRGRIAETAGINYDLVVNTMTSNKVPLIIVQTHLDDEDDPGQWAVDNKRIFKAGGHHAKEIVGTAFPKFNPRRESSDSWSKKTIQESTVRIWDAIERFSSEKPTIFCERHGMSELLKKMWIEFKRRVVKPLGSMISPWKGGDQQIARADDNERTPQMLLSCILRRTLGASSN